jgi:SulP family sulfate permease
MELAGVTARLRCFATLDAALAAVEDAVLAEGEGPAASGAAGGLIARLIARAEAGGAPAFPPETIPSGTAVLRQGDASDALILLESGLLSARVAGSDGDGSAGNAMTVASFLPQTVVGEIGLYAGGPRTATVVAEVDSTIRRITRADLEELSRRDPALARDLHAAIAALLARRLTRTTALLREMSR